MVCFRIGIQQSWCYFSVLQFFKFTFMRRFLSVLTLVTLIQSFPIVVSAQVQPQAKQSSDPIQMVLAANWMTNYPDNKFIQKG